MVIDGLALEELVAAGALDGERSHAHSIEIANEIRRIGTSEAIKVVAGPVLASSAMFRCALHGACKLQAHEGR
jgi:hypothetical protein